MSSSGSSSLLRRALIVDAAVSGATGLVIVLDAGVPREVAVLAEMQYVGLQRSAGAAADGASSIS
jgi:hypothetical protein